MARHWSLFCSGVTERQAVALDRIAEDNDLSSGMALLMQLTGYSRSKVGKMSWMHLRPIIDRAFKEYGRDAQG
jgi:hypothetical protein